MTLVTREELTVEQLVRAISVTPADVLGLPQSLTEGADFNAVLYDPEGEYTLSASEIASGGHNHPLLNRTVSGKVTQVFLEGCRIS